MSAASTMRFFGLVVFCFAAVYSVSAESRDAATSEPSASINTSTEESAQLALQRASTEAETKSAEVARQQLIWSIVQGAISSVTLIALIYSLKLTRDSLLTVKTSNQISKTALVLDNRAWMTSRVQVTRNFEYRGGPKGREAFVIEHASIGLSMKNRNIGRTPAYNSSTNVRVTRDWRKCPRIVQELVKEDEESSRDDGLLVLPNEEYTRVWYPSTEDNEVIESTTSNVGLVVVVSYNVVEDTQRRHTGLVYLISPKSQDSIFASSDGTYSISPDNIELLPWNGSQAT